jgi:hypothetical protein
LKPWSKSLKLGLFLSPSVAAVEAWHSADAFDLQSSVFLLSGACVMNKPLWLNLAKVNGLQFRDLGLLISEHLNHWVNQSVVLGVEALVDGSILVTSAIVADRSRVRLWVGGERHPGRGEAKSRSSIVPMEFLPDRRRPRVEAHSTTPEILNWNKVEQNRGK